MSRYFIEVAYKGTRYSGFQIQQNANTIQAEIEKAFKVLHRRQVVLTGSSRTDAGVHALQNFFHFDDNQKLDEHFNYKMNALLPNDIVIKNLHLMPETSHSRFDAISREYEYKIYRYKNPFLQEVAYYYPYQLNIDLINYAAAYIKEQTNFFPFSKTNTQVKNFNCVITYSEWIIENDLMVYRIKGNRFLRGMVRMLTAALLQIGKEKLQLNDFLLLFSEKRAKFSYSVPAEGLFLKSVCFPPSYFSF